MNVRAQSAASAIAAKPPFRAEHIGSLLRPAKLLRERARFAKGEINATELAAAEDDAIAEAIRLQEGLGFKFVTDGEFRRRSYHFFSTARSVTLLVRTDKADGCDYRQPRAMDPSDQFGRCRFPQNPIGSLAEDHDSRALRVALPRR